MLVRYSRYLAVAELFALFTICVSNRVLSEETVPEDSGLYLFLDEEQQKIEEEKQISAVEHVLPALAETDTEVADDIFVDEESGGMPDPEPLAESAYSRYNGAVLQGSEILGIWINNRRFFIPEDSLSLQIEQTERNGIVRVSTTDDVLLLAPGDDISNQLLGKLLGPEVATRVTGVSTAGTTQ